MHYLRLKIARKKAQKVFEKYHEKESVLKFTDEQINRKIGIYRKTKVFCSGFCCGNPRKHFNEKTRQEKIADENFNYQLGEFYQWKQ